MSIRYWLYAIALGGCLAAILVGLCVLPSNEAVGQNPKQELMVEDRPEGSGEDERSKEETTNPSAIVSERPTVLTVGPEIQSLIADIKAALSDPNAKREQERAEEDLQAQKDMARWARCLLWAVIVEIALTGLGLVFVIQSLLEARRSTRANEAGLDAMREQTRAILSPIGEVEYSFASKAPRVRIRLKNDGSTGTGKAFHFAWIYFSGGIAHPKDSRIRSRQNGTPAQIFAGSPDEQTWRFDFSGEIIPQSCWDSRTRFTVHVSMYAIYIDVFGLLRWQQFVYNCSSKTDPRGGIGVVRMRHAPEWSGACEDEKTEIEKALKALRPS